MKMKLKLFEEYYQEKYKKNTILINNIILISIIIFIFKLFLFLNYYTRWTLIFFIDIVKHDYKIIDYDI